MFRYDRRLKDNPEVYDLVKKAWRNSSNKPIKQRISIVQRALIEWNRNKQRNSQTMIQEMKQALGEAMVSPIHDDSLVLNVNNILKEAYKAEESYWRQTSWLQ